MHRRTEEFINALCSDLIGDPGDYSYGPFLMNRALVPLIAYLGHDIGWGATTGLSHGASSRQKYSSRNSGSAVPTGADCRGRS
jgi:hypothetical protein